MKDPNEKDAGASAAGTAEPGATEVNVEQKSGAEPAKTETNVTVSNPDPAAQSGNPDDE